MCLCSLPFCVLKTSWLFKKQISLGNLNLSLQTTLWSHLLVLLQISIRVILTIKEITSAENWVVLQVIRKNVRFIMRPQFRTNSAHLRIKGVPFAPVCLCHLIDLNDAWLCSNYLKSTTFFLTSYQNLLFDTTAFGLKLRMFIAETRIPTGTHVSAFPFLPAFSSALRIKYCPTFERSTWRWKMLGKLLPRSYAQQREALLLFHLEISASWTERNGFKQRCPTREI